MGALLRKWDTCRACLCRENNMRSLFNRENNEDLLSMFEECLGLPVSRNDNLPDKICETCVGQLREFHEFRQMCQRSQIYIMGCLAKENHDNLFQE